jgi:hypothetical protein
MVTQRDHRDGYQDGRPNTEYMDRIGIPASSCSFSIAMIAFSLNLERFIVLPLGRNGFQLKLGEDAGLRS